MARKFWSCLVAGLSTLMIGQALVGQQDAFDTLPGGAQTDGVPDTNQDQDQNVPDSTFSVPQQEIEVDENRAGWQAAGAGLTEGRLSEELRANWVMVDSNGLLRGTVIAFDDEPIADLAVYLLSRGRVVTQTRVNDQGQFSFNNVQHGSYALIGVSQKHFFAFGFDAIRNTNSPEANAPNSITVMAGPNNSTINTDWISYFSPEVKYRVYGRFTSREGSDDPPALYGTEGLSTHYPNAFPATSIQSHAVTSLSDGRLIGRVHQIDSLNGRPVDVRNTRVMLLQNDDVYAATSTDNFGVFEFTEIAAGFYSLVAAGDDGLAMIGVEVVDRPEVAVADGEDPDSGVVPIDMTLVPSEATGWLMSRATEDAYQRAVAASARANAAREKCNCQPLSPAQQQAIAAALRPNTRGRFWKRLNSYFDQIFYGANSNQGGGIQYPNGAGYGPGYGGGYGAGNYYPPAQQQGQPNLGLAPGYAPQIQGAPFQGVPQGYVVPPVQAPVQPFGAIPGSR